VPLYLLSARFPRHGEKSFRHRNLFATGSDDSRVHSLFLIRHLHSIEHATVYFTSIRPEHNAEFRIGRCSGHNVAPLSPLIAVYSHSPVQGCHGQRQDVCMGMQSAMSFSKIPSSRREEFPAPQPIRDRIRPIIPLSVIYNVRATCLYT
jgi:hypothetical protein